MQFFDSMYEYLKTGDASWIKMPGSKTSDILIQEYYPRKDWQFRQVEDQTGWITLTQDGKTYSRVHWLGDDVWLLSDQIDAPVYVRVVWNPVKNRYQSDGTYYETEEAAKGKPEKKKKKSLKIEPLVTLEEEPDYNEPQITLEYPDPVNE